MTTAIYLSDSANETYNGDAFAYIEFNAEGIRDASAVTGISAGAIAGAMAEENHAYGWTDTTLDEYARSAVDPIFAAATLPLAMAGGVPGYALWAASNAVALAANRTHAQWQADYAVVSGDSAPDALDKILHPVLIDAGPGNFKIKTAIDLVMAYGNDPEYTSFGLTSYQTDYALLVQHLMDDRHPLTAQLYAIYMKEVAEPWFIDNNAYGGQWSQLPQTFRDALLVTFTNRGPASMETSRQSYISQGLPYEPQPGLTTSGGTNHLLNASAIGSALSLAGYGDDVADVGNFAAELRDTENLIT